MKPNHKLSSSPVPLQALADTSLRTLLLSASMVPIMVDIAMPIIGRILSR